MMKALCLICLEILILEPGVMKLMHVRSRLDQRKFSFCSRVVGYWNSLPDYVVKASSINMFKNSLDKLWIKEEMYYDFEANMSYSCY